MSYPQTMHLSSIPIYHDNIPQEVSTLKHNTLVLRNENIEIKQYLMELTKSKFELNKEVKFLKEAVSQLIEQQALFNDSLLMLDKDLKTLRRDNLQNKSKYDLLQLRFKSFQGTYDQSPFPKNSSPQAFYGNAFQNDERENLSNNFQLSPRLDNIINKSTRERLENLKKDLEGVFQKNNQRVDTLETGKDEKETIMEEWSNPSELNTSQAHSERSQFTIVTHQAGDMPFESLGILGPSSLMDQLEMLNLQQGSPKNFYGDERGIESTTFSKVVSFGDASPKSPKTAQGSGKSSNALKSKPSFGRTSPISNENTNVSKGALQSASSKVLPQHNKGIPEFRAEEIKVPQIRIQTEPQTFSNVSKVQTQNAIPSYTGIESYSNYSGYHNVGERAHTENSYYRATGTPHELPKNAFGIMDVKKKKEMYLKGDNMLIEVLDKLEEQSQRGGIAPSSNSHRSEGGTSYRYIESNKASNTDLRHQERGYYFPQKAVESGQVQENEREVMIKNNVIEASSISNISEINSTGTTNSSRGTKKLKLVRKNMKSTSTGKEEFRSLQGSISSNLQYDQ